MALMRWRPMRDLLSIQEEVNRLFDEFFGRFPSRLDVFETGWTPSVDIRETKDDIIVEAELPGIKQDDVSVSITDNVLTIKGEKKQEKEVKEEQYHRIERSYGAFQRSFTLPTVVQADKARATFKDGVLKMRLVGVQAVGMSAGAWVMLFVGALLLFGGVASSLAVVGRKRNDA